MEKSESIYTSIWRWDIIQFLALKQVKCDTKDHQICADTFQTLSTQLIRNIETTDLFFSLSSQDIIVINNILPQFNTFCNTVNILDSLHASDVGLLGDTKAHELLSTSENINSEISLHSINRKELIDKYTDHKNTLIDIFEIYKKFNISQKLRAQMKITKLPFTFFTYIKNVFCGKSL